ncbi:MAG: MBL fold metallo-hydrolase [Bacteroidota bacterium]
MKPPYLFSLFVLLGLVPLTAQDFSTTVIIPERINDRLYKLEGAGGNIGVLLGEDGVLLIDTQYGPLGDKIKTVIQELGGDQPQYVVNTHWHGDHTGGNEYFNTAGALLIAHENVYLRKRTDQLMRAFGRSVPAAPRAAWPELTFSENMNLHLNGEDILLLHVHDAHTDGDVHVYFTQSNVLHMGDTYFQATFPFIDISSGGTLDGMIESANQALFLVDDETVIIPGHGALSNRSELIDYRDMLQTISTRVKQSLAAGLSLEELKAAKLTAEFEERWGQGWMKADRFIEIVHGDLSR